MKKWFSSGNIIFLLLLGFLIASQAPTIANNFRKEGSKLEGLKSLVINSAKEGEKAQFPPKEEKAMAIFWSTTCAPCKLEMARLKASVENGKIPKSSLFAINPFEGRGEIKKFLAKNDYPFTFIEAPGVGQALNVQGTPTTIFIDKGRVVSVKTGISLTGIWKAEAFFEK
tara:strand:+ start:1766 stop:2275 length:510 start_codon:yes stop_codon:yes gene_type:complete